MSSGEHCGTAMGQPHSGTSDRSRRASSASRRKKPSQQGEALLRENCSRCHAIGKEGESPHKEAPPFRTLSRKYPVKDLAESLAEGIVSGHPDMPIFTFDPHDVAAIIDYLESIQDPTLGPSEFPGELKE